MSTRFAVTLWLTVKGPERAQHFDHVVARYADLERRHDGLLDCAWSLADHDTHAAVDVELTVLADSEAAAYALAGSSVRAAIHDAGGRTPEWGDPEPALDAVVYRLANEAVTVV